MEIALLLHLGKRGFVFVSVFLMSLNLQITSSETLALCFPIKTFLNKGQPFKHLKFFPQEQALPFVPLPGGFGRVLDSLLLLDCLSSLGDLPSPRESDMICTLVFSKSVSSVNLFPWFQAPFSTAFWIFAHGFPTSISN